LHDIWSELPRRSRLRFKVVHTRTRTHHTYTYAYTITHTRIHAIVSEVRSKGEEHLEVHDIGRELCGVVALLLICTHTHTTHTPTHTYTPTHTQTHLIAGEVRSKGEEHLKVHNIGGEL